MKRILAVLASLLILFGVLPVAAASANPVYTTPGYHTSAGREWKTSCEGYSGNISRCWTWIHGTTIQQQGGKYVPVTGWQFNNLTYIGGTRAEWGSNKMAHSGYWSHLGRNYKTSCADSWTGPNGCRTFIQGTLVIPNGKGGYTKKTDWVFNNVVAFGTAKPGKPSTQKAPAVATKPPAVATPNFTTRTCSTGRPGSYFGISYTSIPVKVSCTAPDSRYIGAWGVAYGGDEIRMSMGRKPSWGTFSNDWSIGMTHEMAHIVDWRVSWATRARLYRWIGISNPGGPDDLYVDTYNRDGSVSASKWRKAPQELFAESVVNCLSPGHLQYPEMARVPKAKCGGFLTDYRAAVAEAAKQK